MFRVGDFQILVVGRGFGATKNTSQESSPLMNALFASHSCEIRPPPPSKIQTTIHPRSFAFPEGLSCWKAEAGRTEMKSVKKTARRPAPGTKDKMGLRSVEMMEERHLETLVERF